VSAGQIFLDAVARDETDGNSIALKFDIDGEELEDPFAPALDPSIPRPASQRHAGLLAAHPPHGHDRQH
jgi:hypothetical protein